MKIACEICGKLFKVVNALHLRKHDITVEQYTKMYPNAPIYNEETRAKMSNSSNAWYKNNTKKLSDITKDKIRQKAIGRKTGPRSDETKARMRQAWCDNYDHWCASIKESANKPERKERARVTQQKIIAERGYHLARGKESSFEKFAREILESKGFTVKTQKQTKTKIHGAKRYFDIFVEELNLIIELDGEFWHTRHERIEIDKGKTEAAINEGFNFLRISDADFSRNYSHEIFEKFLALSNEDKLKHSHEVIARRESVLKVTQQE